MAGSNDPPPPRIDVAAAVIRDAEGRVLVTQRLPGRHLAGQWEFPGGKIEPGEAPNRALARELAEELGIEAGPMRPLVSVTHEYPATTVRLRLFELHSYAGTPEGREGQALQWVDVDRLRELDMPAADRPLVRLLQLDAHYSISPSPGTFADPERFLAGWQACLDAGFRLLRLRLEADEHVAESLVEAIAERTRAAGARWLVSGALDRVCDWPADGVHLSTRQLVESHRRPIDADRLLAASCHDLEEIRMAADLDADFVTLAPVAASARRPGVLPLGWHDFERVVRHSPLPVLALGGLEPDDWGHARAAGAFGVAGVRAFGWGNDA
ncbi:Nudix family hydrolase [Wenzhouxiangella sp. XN79A]|uniref:Nudix family hydrolase n=1 Tax=Wenzhouxiangella sp. XN79A TaxID=2724193 RepID=UPI00144ABCEE|nr:Nudix family hydrolase [Wenzhouxiangella sp. XN79A]